MLIDFQTTNFRSFKNSNDFSMEKGKYIRKYKNNVLEFGKLKLLKSALLFGGNANGKTNLIIAIMSLRELILSPTTSENQKLKTDTFGYNKENTFFDIKFWKNDKVFEYNLIYNADEIVFETLIVNRKVSFERNYQKFEKLPEQLKAVEKNIRKNQNLLYFAQNNNVDEAKMAFSWFLEDVVIVNTDQISNALFKSLKDTKFKRKFLKFLQAADFNIVDVEVKEREELGINFQFDLKNAQVAPLEESHPMTRTIYEVYSMHKSEENTFQVHFNNESKGTKVFMFLALYILGSKNSGKVLLIDEFDSFFHMELAEDLLDLFNDKKQKNQFILTTHELSLMDYNMRQDQIWFAEKNEYSETELFSIYDFNDIELKRGDFSYKKRYLEGRFGASQIINKTVLLEVLEGDNDV